MIQANTNKIEILNDNYKGELKSGVNKKEQMFYTIHLIYNSRVAILTILLFLYKTYFMFSNHLIR